jgi:methylglutaconyl-CoA hydratase
MFAGLREPNLTTLSKTTLNPKTHTFMAELVEIQKSGSIAWLRLNRPEKRNALMRQTLDLLSSKITELDTDRTVRTVVLAANGSVFCAGMDLAEMQQRAESPGSADEWRQDSQVYCDVLSKLYSLRVPTIAAVNGAAVAGGVGLVLACDFVISATDAFFALPEPMRGITAAMVTPLLVHRIGAGAANRLLLSGERWNAAQGQAVGLCHDVVSANELNERVTKLAESIQSGSIEALAITKSHLQTMAGGNMLDLLTQSMTVSAQARETPDAREGLDAFLQKRKPSWQ